MYPKTYKRMKKIAILLLIMACATTSVHAQHIQIIAEFKEIK